MEHETSYRVGFFLGGLIRTAFSLLFRNVIVGTIFVIACVVFNIMGIFWGTMAIPYCLGTTIVIILLIGIIGKIVQFPFSRKQRYYTEMFERMQFSSKTGEYPIFIHEDENQYLHLLVFKTQIPLSVWVAHQELIETYINAPIHKIENMENNNNIIFLYTIIRSLPERIYWNDEYQFSESDLLSMGIGYEDITVLDLSVSPHSFIAGETGSGKSNLMKCLIYQCILKQHDIILIDFKRGVSFAVFERFIDVYSDYTDIIAVLHDLVEETKRRLDLFKRFKVDDISRYNRVAPQELSRIVVFIDELAELVRTSDKQASKEIIGYLETLTRISRAVGINLIMGIQRPDATVINGQIKNNVSTRICGRFVDPEPSRIMFGNDLATTLPPTRGRFILKDNGYYEFQAFYFSDSMMNYIDTTLNMDVDIEEEIEVKPHIDKQSDTSIDFDFGDIDIMQ